MSVNKINQASNIGVKSHLARSDASHTTVKAPSITQSANSRRKCSTGLAEANSKDSSSSQANKKVAVSVPQRIIKEWPKKEQHALTHTHLKKR